MARTGPPSILKLVDTMSELTSLSWLPFSFKVSLSLFRSRFLPSVGGRETCLHLYLQPFSDLLSFSVSWAEGWNPDEKEDQMVVWPTLSRLEVLSVPNTHLGLFVWGLGILVSDLGVQYYGLVESLSRSLCNKVPFR